MDTFWVATTRVLCHNIVISVIFVGPFAKRKFGSESLVGQIVCASVVMVDLGSTSNIYSSLLHDLLIFL